MDFEPNFAWAPRFSTGTDLHSMVLHQKLPGPSTLVAGVYAFRFLQIFQYILKGRVDDRIFPSFFSGQNHSILILTFKFIP